MKKSAPYEFLKTLLNTPSPSGFETRGQKVWVDYVKHFADSVEIDAYGNAFATLNPASGKGDPTVLFSGHVDELGLMISHISTEGFLYFKGIGGVDRTLIRGQRVTIHGAQGAVPGVTGLLAIHLQEPDDRNKVPEMHTMHIDIGVSSKKEAEKLVRVGDTQAGVVDGHVEPAVLARRRRRRGAAPGTRRSRCTARPAAAPRPARAGRPGRRPPRPAAARGRRR
jgi:putative aminopeptidase FrvX